MGVAIKVENGIIRTNGPKNAIESLAAEIRLWKAELIRRNIDGPNTPYINTKDDLIIPVDSDPKYHYWAGGKG